MKVLIVSDSHGKNQYLHKAIEQVAPIDLLIHLGDIECEAEYIRSIAPCPLEIVAGNNDFINFDIPREKILKIGRYKVMITHGHRYDVYYNTSTIREIAMENKIDIVMFGHTHVPMITFQDNIWLINPGSISLPRQNGREHTFIVMDIDSKGKANFTLKHIK